MTEATAPAILPQHVAHETLPVALRPRLETTWAVLCGAVASGALSPSGASIVRLLAGWLVADIVLGYALAQLLATVWVARRVGAPTGCAPTSGPQLPYAEPDSPGDRLTRAMARWVEHWNLTLRPAIGHHAASFVTASATALLVGAYLGQPVLTGVAAALVAAGILVLVHGHDTEILVRWYAGIGLGIAWYLGHQLYSDVPPGSWGVAALIGLAALARAAQQGDRPVGGRRLLGIVWAVFVTAMLVARQPIAAGVTAIAGLAELMGLGVSTSRTARIGWLAAMLLAALIVAAVS